MISDDESRLLDLEIEGHKKKSPLFEQILKKERKETENEPNARNTTLRTRNQSRADLRLPIHKSIPPN